jgi:malonate transporter
MIQVAGLVAPVFAIIVLGRFAKGRLWPDEAGLAALTGFTFWIALPALLFGSIAETKSSGLFNVAGIYLVACLIVYGGSMLVSYLLFGGSIAQQAIFGLNATYGNVIYLGTPIVAAVFGPPGLSLILAIIAFHSGVLLPLAACLIEAGSPRQGGVKAVLRRSAAGLARHPIIIAIFLGFAWQVSHFPLPGPLHSLIGILGQAATPLALFNLGASLPPLSRDHVAVREAVTTTAIKLVCLPLCVGGLTWAAGLDGLPMKVAVVTASMPTGANAFMLARRATNFAAASASTVVITTAVSVVTLTALLILLR